MDDLAELSPIDEDDEEFKTTAYANNAFAINEEKMQRESIVSQS